MADEAVGHLRKVVVGNGFVLLNAAVAGGAGVLVAFEVLADAGRGFGGEVVLLVDGRGEQLRDVAGLEVLLVAEAVNLGSFGRTDRPAAGVAADAFGFVWEIVVLDPGAGDDVAVAVDALRDHLEMELVGEFGGLGVVEQSRAQEQNNQ